MTGEVSHINAIDERVVALERQVEELTRTLHRNARKDYSSLNCIKPDCNEIADYLSNYCNKHWDAFRKK